MIDLITHDRGIEIKKIFFQKPFKTGNDKINKEQ